jgi:hypothetical protein
MSPAMHKLDGAFRDRPFALSLMETNAGLTC